MWGKWAVVDESLPHLSGIPHTQVMVDSGFAPSPRWASEVKSVLSGTLFALPTEHRGLVMKYLQEATRQSW